MSKMKQGYAALHDGIDHRTLASVIGYALLVVVIAIGLRSAKCATFSDANWMSLSAPPGAVGSGLPGTITVVSTVLANTNAGLIYVGGQFVAVGTTLANNVAAWNGTNWSALGLGVSNRTVTQVGPVTALALDGTGNLYVGGTFNYAGGQPATNIAKWDGTNWSPVGPGLNNSVSALAFDNSGNLYAGGAFTMAGSAAVSYIAKWDGTSWSPLGSGVNANVSGITLDGSGNLYAGGFFTTAGGAPAKFIAKWNGSVWSALASGMNNIVYALAVDISGNLFAGGTFTASGSTIVKGIAMWNGYRMVSTRFGPWHWWRFYQSISVRRFGDSLRRRQLSH